MSPLAVEWVGGWLSPELLGPWSGMYVLLCGPLYVSIWPGAITVERRWLS